ncbi:MAG: discoidin domain-containing protein [Chitinophagales bacterium]|nr:discoidin domain-containing protein [Chitinophagales bacterium]MDW8419076.1 LamG-like jellyroll fold domain-containing protein [Chitinophagales bacterium]
MKKIFTNSLAALLLTIGILRVSAQCQTGCWNWWANSGGPASGLYTPTCTDQTFNPPSTGYTYVNLIPGASYTFSATGGSGWTTPYVEAYYYNTACNTWVCITAANSSITFNAPNSCGDYHYLIVVRNGNTCWPSWPGTSATLTYRANVSTSAGSIGLSAATICNGNSVNINSLTNASTSTGTVTATLRFEWWRENGVGSGNWTLLSSNSTSQSWSDVPPGPGTYRYLRRAYHDGNWTGAFCGPCAFNSWTGATCVDAITGTLTVISLSPPQALGNITCGPAAGLTGALADANFSASGCWDGGNVNSDCSSPGWGGHQAWRGRVFRDGGIDGGVVGWAVDQNNTGDWWQVDLGSVRPVNGIASQGREDADQWLTQYTVQLSYDGSNWFNVPGTFTANGDRNTVVTNWFGQYHARYVRINTINNAYVNHQSARFEVLSIPEGSSNTVVLSADIVPNADQVRWYTTPTGGSPITTGGIYTVGSNGRTLQITGLSTNTTYYAEAYNSSLGCVSPTRTAVIARVNNINACGPGGIGSTSGNSLMNLWLDGQVFNNTANGTAVSTWTDKSGRGNHATQGTAANQPQVQTDAAMNNQKLVRADGTNDFLSTPNNIYNYSGSFYGSNTTPFGVFGVARYRGINGRIISGNGNNWLLGHHNNHEQRAYYEGWLTGSCGGGGLTPPSGTTRIVYGDRGRAWSRFFDNGNLIAQADCGPQAPGGFTFFSYIGGSEWSNGDLAEVIAYELPLNTARRRILDNYLSAKYATAIANDLYAGDDASNGNCDFDVSGVGRDFTDGIGVHLTGCSEGLTMTTTIADYLKDNGDYIIFGHNRHTLYSWETSDLATCGTPNPSRRLSRIWYIDKTDVSNNGGNVTLTFDIGTTPITGTYRLLYRPGNSGNFSSIATHSSISGNTVIFTINASSINDGQYTLGYDADIPRAVTFDGTNGNCVFVPNHTSLQTPGDFTYEMWVRPTNFTSNNTYFENGTWAGQTTLLRQDVPGSINLYISGTAVGALAYAPPLNQWTHLALVRSGGTISLYANGTLVGNFTTSYSAAITPTTSMFIGSSTHTTGQNFIGSIDEFRLWNVARTPSEISSNMHANIHAASSGWNNLQAYYKFNESGGAYFDLSRNANNASLVGSSATRTALYTANPNSIAAQTICSGASTTFTVTNGNANSRLTYQWSVPSGVSILSGGTTPTVSVSSTNSGTSVISYTLTVTETHSNECHTETQTATLHVRPVPQATISGTTTVCVGAPSPVITFTNPTSLQIQVTYNINGGPNQYITVNANSNATVTQSTATAGTFTYNIQSVEFTTAPACATPVSGSVTITVVPDPSISGLSGATICKGGTHTFMPTTSGGTGTFTYIWEYNSGTWNPVVNGTPAGFTYNQSGANLQITTTNTVGAATYQYRLRFQASGSGCDEAQSTVNLVVLDKPSVTNPVGANICEGSSHTMSVTASGGITPYTFIWQYFNGTTWVNAVNGTPAGASYTGLGTNSITVSGLSGGTGTANYQYRVIVQSSGGNGCDDAISASATIQVNKIPSITNNSTSLCEGATKNLTTDLDNTSGVTWTSSPACGSCLSGGPSPAPFVFTAPNPGGASANYILTARNANNSSCSSFYIQTVYSQDPSNAGPDQTQCNNGTFTMAANIPNFGTGQWTCITNCTGVNIVSPGSNTSTVSGVPANTTTTLRWRIINGACISDDYVDLKHDIPASITSSGADMCEFDTRTLTASIGGGTWSATCGPCVSGNVFTAPNVSGTSSTFTITYAVNSCPNPSQNITVYNTPQPAVNAGPDKSICGTTTTLNATPLTIGSGVWTVLSGTGLFSSNTSPNPNVTGMSYGSNTYRWTATNGACNVHDDVEVKGNLMTTNIASTNPGTYIATRECLNESDNWTHYFHNGPDATPNTADDYRVISIKKNGNDIGKVGDGTFDARQVLDTTSTTFGSGYGNGGYYISEATAPYVANNVNGWIVMGRYWKVTPTNQPTSDVNVKFYFDKTDYDDILNTAYSLGWEPIQKPFTDLQFYKVHSPKNPAPSTGHVGYTHTDVDIYVDTLFHPYVKLWTFDSIGTGKYVATFSVNSFSGGGGGFGGGGQGALPIELLYLTATGVNNQYIRIDWATALEINNSGFEVQRSTDAQNWTTLAWVPGQGNSTVQNTYQYVDHDVMKGVVYYYRLKQVDWDGKFTYTYIVSAVLDGKNSFTVMDFVPNPTMEQTNLLITANVGTEITVEFYNSIGEKMSSNRYILQSGLNTIPFTVNHLAAGTYTAIVTNGNEVYSKKLVIAR